jgi:hypothetical protein
VLANARNTPKGILKGELRGTNYAEVRNHVVAKLTTPIDPSKPRSAEPNLIISLFIMYGYNNL